MNRIFTETCTFLSFVGISLSAVSRFFWNRKKQPYFKNAFVGTSHAVIPTLRMPKSAISNDFLWLWNFFSQKWLRGSFVLSRSQLATFHLRSTLLFESYQICFLPRNPDSPKSPKIAINFDLSLFSNSPFSINIGLASSINLLIDAFLSVEGSSNWKLLIFWQAPESW